MVTFLIESTAFVIAGITAWIFCVAMGKSAKKRDDIGTEGNEDEHV